MAHYLEGKGEKIDDIFYFSTNLVKEKIAIREKNDFTIMTHEECFKRRISTDFPNLEGAFHAIDYDETKDADNSIHQVASMAEKIKKYIRRYEGEAVYLHADMTGGMRHASMMMLSVIQLLKFSGIRVGQVVYSDFQHRKIVNVTEVHRMFSLVSGADEFVKYGSVAAIDEYFGEVPKEHQSKELRELLTAMRNFSDAIKICKIDAIEGQLQIMNGKIENFRQKTDKSLQEELFAQIIDTIQHEYGLLLAKKPYYRKASRLDIIAWCTKRGFLQQAMTMCTEWVPFFIVREKICYPVGIDGSKLFHPTNGRRYWEQQFIKDYVKTPRIIQKLAYSSISSSEKLSCVFTKPDIISDYTEKYVSDVLKIYFSINKQRNNINHVNEQGVKTANQIKKMITTCVNLLKHKDEYRIRQ
jgi:hypothetical protein